MKFSAITIVNRLGALILFGGMMWACRQENVAPLTPEQTRALSELAAKDNSQIVATTQDILDVTADAMISQGITDGRSSSYEKSTGPHFDCSPSISGNFNIDRSHADSVVFSGSIIVDYGNGSSCNDSTEVRKGKITSSFVLVKKLFGTFGTNLKEVITFQGYQIDSIQLDGSFTVKSSSGTVSTLDIQNAKITYSDGASTSWHGTLTSTFDTEKSGSGKSEGWSKTRKVTGSIEGTSRTGVTFSANVTKAILFKYSCNKHIPIAGTVELTVGSAVSTIEYGNGTCDKSYTITTAGVTKEYRFKQNQQG